VLARNLRAADEHGARLRNDAAATAAVGAIPGSAQRRAIAVVAAEEWMAWRWHCTLRMTEPARILVPGATCATTLTTTRSGLLVDGRDYYRAVHDACRQAQRSILMLGWQFDSRVDLLRGGDEQGAEHAVQLLAFLGELCEQRPDLHVYILAWRSSPVFALEREPFQSLTFKLRSHSNLRFELDDCHPATASQHQKLVVVDRAVAFLGGMDLCASRWDDRSHCADDARRPKPAPGVGRYGPYHDVQAYVTGDAVDVLREWFAERWRRGTCEEITLPPVARAEVAFTPTLAIDVPDVGLVRTLPEYDDPPATPVYELRELHHVAIAAAQSSIYIENQYFSSEDVRRALIDRMRAGGQLEIVIVLPAKSGGFKEQVAIGVRQSEILRELEAVAVQTGHHLGIYYPAAPGEDGDVPVFVHSKVLTVDDRFLLVSSCNTTNRSLGLDSELGIAWETDRADESLRAARIELMREHCGLDATEADDILRPEAGLVARLDGLARARSHRLRLHAKAEDTGAARAIAHALREDVPLDPNGPVFEDIWGEPDHWYRHVRDHLGLAWRRLRFAVRPTAAR
jgi:phospholipase D1/2